MTQLTILEPTEAAVERSHNAAQAKIQIARKVRVLFLDHTAMLSGGEIALLRLIGELDRQKVAPVAVLGADGPLVDALRPIAETHVLPLSAGVASRRKDSLGLKSLLRFREVWGVFSYIVRLAIFIRRNNIDLIHTNSLKCDIIGGAAGRLAMRPVLWHVRDRIDADYLPKRVVSLFRILCRIVPRYVIANSFATLRTLHLPERTLRFTPLLKKRAMAIHDGTHVDEVGLQQDRIPGPIRIGLVGRICSWKGQHIFLRAAASVHERYPHAEFIIIGSPLFGEQKYEQELHQLTNELAINSVVHFAGFRTDVQAAIAELDVLVHASTIGEPFGQVIIEGMAAGKPVVATNGGGVPEIVQDDDTGILIPMGNADAMADAICRLLADPIFAREMGRRGRQRVINQFTVAHTARRIEDVYDSILSA